MSLIEYKGFGGVPLSADMLGDDNDPAVLLIPDVGQPRSTWRAVAEGLVLSGRRVVNLDLRAPGGVDQLAAHVEDLRLVLAQMGSRPVVVAARHGGWIATRALATDGILLAGGLVLVDMPDDADAVASGIAARQALPTLVVRGGFAAVPRGAGGDAFHASHCFHLCIEDVHIAAARVIAVPALPVRCRDAEVPLVLIHGELIQNVPGHGSLRSEIDAVIRKSERSPFFK